MRILHQIKTLTTYVVLEAFRTRFFIIVFLLLFISFGLTLFLGQIAITEIDAVKSSLLATFLRLSAVYAISLFVITSMVHEFNEQSIYLWLSFPLSRSVYLLGKLCGFILVSTLIGLLFGVTLLQYAPYLQVGLWTLSLCCELFIIATASLLCVLSFQRTMQAFSAILSFYLLARSIDAIRLMAQAPLQDSPTWSTQFISGFVKIIATLLPDFSYFTQTAWLVYHTGDFATFLTIIGQTAIYGTLLIAMCLFDLYRKNL
jgi:hypothetical protein